MSSQAKKWVYTTGGFPNSLKQTTYTPPSPSTLRPTQIQVRTKAFAINPVDVQAINLYRDSPSLLPWPLSALAHSSQDQQRETCCDFSGVVTHAGAEADGLRVGDEVFGITLAPMSGVGTAGEVLTLDTAPGAPVAVARKPAGLDFMAAAAVPLVWLTARVCVEAVAEWVEKQRGVSGTKGAGGAEEKWVVVLGASSATGMNVVRLARARGWRVLATCSRRNLKLVRDRLGVEEVVDRTAVGEGSEALPGEILRRLEARGVVNSGGSAREVVIVDCVGGTDCLLDAALGPRIARYVTIVGDKRDRASMGGPAIYASHPRMVARWLAGKAGLGVSYDCVILEAKKEWLEEAAQTLSREDVVVDSTFKFDELPMALQLMVEGNITGKIVGVLD